MIMIMTFEEQQKLFILILKLLGRVSVKIPLMFSPFRGFCKMYHFYQAWENTQWENTLFLGLEKIIYLSPKKTAYVLNLARSVEPRGRGAAAALGALRHERFTISVAEERLFALSHLHPIRSGLSPTPAAPG